MAGWWNRSRAPLQRDLPKAEPGLDPSTLVLFHCFPAGSLLPSYVLNCPMGYRKIPHCLLWNQFAELWHSPHFISGALSRKLHPILCTASYTAGKNRFLKTCNFELIYKLVAFTKVTQLPLSIGEQRRQTQEWCFHKLWSREEFGAPWHWAMSDVRSPGQADSTFNPASPCSWALCWLGMPVLAQGCLHLWAVQVCKGVAKQHQLHMKRGSWGYKALLAP